MNKNSVKKSKISKKRRNNAILYPIYKMVSWDLLCFYSVEFLFYTITKGITASQVLLITASYMLGKLFFQIPSVAIADYLGKRKSLIIGNAILIAYMILIIYSPGLLGILIATALSGFGYDIKAITESNLLYDSVATRGGDGIYTKIDSKGASAYYVIDTVLSVIAGYLFVINNYIPMYICLFFLILSFVLSFKFEDIHRSKKEKTGINLKEFLSGYSKDIKSSFNFIRKSNRMKSYVLFATVFYGVIKIMSTCKNDLLIDMKISEEQFSLIYAALSLIAAISAMFSKKVQRKFKNRTLKLISLSYIFSIIGVGIISIKLTNEIAIPLVLMLCCVMRISDSQWYVTEYTYLKNFTNYDTRVKITFTFELIVVGVTSLIAALGSLLLKYIEIRYAILFLGLLALALITIVLDYMRTRIGLKPKEYKKEDIEFVSNK